MAVDEHGNEIITPVVPPVVKPNAVEERITDLSSKVKTASDERDAALARVEAAEKKAAFATDFVEVAAEFAAAREHKADIEAKVMSGYTVKDATFAVLGAAGKLGAPKVERTPIAGGSASTNITIQSNKPATDMTREERRAALIEAERKGDLGLS
jgi:hypothetical protein